MEIKISVIVNFYNGEKYIKYCLMSILKQNYKNLEIILWDNCSNDSSYEVIKKFNDDRIKYFYNKKKEPLYRARNLAIKNSTGNFIAFLDCDDWWENNYLSSRIEYLKKDEFSFYYSNVNFYFEKTKKKKLYKSYSLPDGKLYNFLSIDYFIIISAVIFKRDVFEKFGMFNENYNIIGDYDFIMGISKICRAKSINKPLLNYRVHDSNFSKENTSMFYNEYKDWFERQVKLKDIMFTKNIDLFKRKLALLEVKHLLLDGKKNLSLFKKILIIPGYSLKIKYLIAFFLPKNIYHYFR